MNSLPPSPLAARPRRFLNRAYRPAWLVLLAAAGLSAGLADWAAQRLDERAQARLEALADRQQARLQARFDLYPRGLRGLRGLFLDNAEAVTPDQFHQYVASRDLGREFPGALAWAFIERLPAAEAAHHLMQRHGLTYRRAPDAGATPAEAWVLRLGEPADVLPAPGQDLAALAALQDAARASLQDGQPRLSAPFSLLPGRAPDRQFMLLPVYQGMHTPGNVIGWSAVLLDTSAAFLALGEDAGLAGRLAVELRDRSATDGAAALLYRQAPLLPALFQPRTPPALAARRELDLYGRKLEAGFHALPGFYSGTDYWLPPLALAGGLLLGLLGAGLLFFRARLREEAATLAIALTAAVRERKTLLQATLSSLPDWVFILDAQGAVLDCHAGSEGGWLAREDFLGKALAPLLPAAAAADLHAGLRQAGSDGHASFGFDLPGGGLQPRQFSARLAVRRDANGQLAGYTLSAREVTAERSHRRQLEARAARFQDIFQALPQAVLLCKRERYFDANPAALRLFSVPDAMALQHAELGLFSPLLQPDGRLSVEAIRELQQRVQEQGPQRFEWTFQRLSDSETFPAEVGVAALDLDGEPCFLCAITDLSPHKQAEALLTQARDAAEAATREKSEFLATMSHEIRTPMNGVLGMAQLLANTALTPEQRDYLATIQQSGQGLLTIINDILDFSKIEAGKLSFEEAPFDLQVAVEETCELLLPQLREKALALTLRLEPGTPFQVIGDAGRFRQVLLNYLSNAIKFTSQGGITVSLRAREAGRGAAFFELAVADTGIGIDPGKQGQLFRKFAQADASATRRFGGTGLGLAICKALVERMGGEVSMSSAPGQGSVFRATFWMSLDPGPGKDSLPVLLPALRESPVLVMDAAAASREAIVNGLDQAGLSVQGAASLEAALAAARTVPPRFVVMDADLPDADLDTALAALRAEPALQNAALLLVSSQPHRNDHAFCRAHGIAAFLPKPARLAWLLGSLNVLIAGDHDGVVTRQTLASHHARGKALPALRPGIRVLLAEDNAVNQKVAARMLEKMGCHVDLAGNGIEALVMVSQLPYDLVLMDVQMPEMDGISATRSLRAQGFAGLPIVALTANNREADRQECRSAGMNDFLAKPIRYEELHACLSRWVRRQLPA